MKFRSVIRRTLALLLLLAILAGVTPLTLAAQTEDVGEQTPEAAAPAQDDAALAEDTAPVADDTPTQEVATRDATARAAVTPVQTCTTDYSDKEIYGFWLNPGSSYYPITQASMTALANKGVTDVYVLVKGELGEIDTTPLTTAIKYKGDMRIHAWVMAGKDENYIKNVNSNVGASHFRWGLYNRVGGDYYNANAVMAYIDLRNTTYRNYFLTNVVDVLANISGLSGIHLDTIRYGTINYGWDANLKSALGKTDYNTVAKALCVTNGYTYSTDSNGYIIYKEGGTTATGSTLEELLAANNSAAKKLLNYRTQTVTSFITAVQNRLSTKYPSKNLTVTAAMMPEAAASDYAMMQYGQSAASLGTCVDYVTLMAYLNEYNANDSTAYPLDYAWAADLAENVARQGCNVVAGLQGYPNDSKYPSGDELRAQVQYVHNRRRTINGDPTVKGDILGTAVFNGGHSAYAEVKYSPSAQTLSVKLVNSTQKAITRFSVVLLTYSGSTKLTYNSSGTLSGVGTPTVTTTSGNQVLTWTTSVASGAVKEFTIPVSGPTTANYNNVAFCTIRTYYGSSYTTISCYPREYPNSAHTSCTYTRVVSKSLAATCTSAGYNVYVCSTCGDSYCEYIPARGGHDFSAGTGSCAVCGTKDTGELIHFKAGSEETTWDWKYQNTSDTSVTYDTSENGSMIGTCQSTNSKATYFLVWQNGKCSFSHTLSDGDVMRVRYRVKVTSNPNNVTTAVPQARFHTNVEANFSGHTGTATQSISLSSTEWQTVEIPIVGTTYMAGDIIDRVLFSPFGVYGSIGAEVEIDYIYIGQKATAPVTVTFVDDDGSVLEVHPVAYGDYASFYGGEPSKPSTDTIRYLFSGWRDSSGNVVDLSTKTFTADATLTANYAEIHAAPLGSTKTISDPKTGDDSYLLTLDAYTYGKTLTLDASTPLNISIVLDRSGSMSFPANPSNDKSFADPTNLSSPDLTALNAYLKTLDKTRPEGYYTATNWLSVPFYATSEYGYGYVSFEPMRYNQSTQTWQVWMTKSPDELKAYVDSTEDTTDTWDQFSYPFGIATVGLSTNGFGSYNPLCGDWVNVTDAYVNYVTRRNACKSDLSDYDLTKVPFKISVPRRSVLIAALNNFIDELYASSGDLEAGKYHSVSIVSYGYGVYANGESVTVQSAVTYKTSSAPTISTTGIVLDSTSDVSKLKSVLNSCYSYGTTRTDLGIKKGQTYLAAQKTANPDGKSVMLLVTDGAPTAATAFDTTIANTVINTANTLKNSGTEIFTLGFMSGLNYNTGYTASYSSSTATDVQKANNFLNLVSSNYPNATSMTSAGTKSTGTYFFSTANGAEIADYMDEIFISTTEVETATIEGTILLYDIVKREWVPSEKQSDGRYFTYTVKSYDYLGVGAFSTTGKTLDSSKYTIVEEPYGTEGDIAIYIRWTDAPNAYLREETVNGTKGYKIEVSFPITVNRDRTYGGNNIPTNGSGSGAYYPDSTESPSLSTVYPVPNVNVEPQYDIIVHDYFVSLYNKGSTNDLVSIIANNGSTEPFVGMYTRKLQPDGLNNRYLKIAHFVDDANGIRRWAETLKAGWTYSQWSAGQDKTLDVSAYGTSTSFDYSKDMTGFKTGYILTPTTKNKDSLGNAPYSVTTVTKTTNYYAPKFAVVDFGTNIDVALDAEASLSPTVKSNCTISSDKKTLTYSGNTILEGIVTAKYKVTAINTPKDTSSVNRTVHIIPANVVAYESYGGFLTIGDGWQSEGTYTALSQLYDNTVVHGYDPLLRDAGKALTNSYGQTYKATVDEENIEKTMTFHFTGTGFDVISQTGPDEGAMVVEVYSDEAMTKVERRFLTLNYLKDETLYQVPVVHCDDLTYGKHYVKIRAFYNQIFNVNAATRATWTEAKIRAALGLTEDEPLEYSLPDLSATRAATRSASATSYDVHVDGIRIYQTMNATPADKAAAYAYSLAEESGSTFVNLKDILLDSDSWTSGTQESGSDGIAYIAATGSNAGSSDTTEGIHLNMSGELKSETVDGKNYLLTADGARLTSKTYGTDIYFTFSNGVYSYFCTDAEGTEVALTAAEVANEELVFYDAAYDTVGPENEVYLKGHNAIAFHVGDSFDISSARILISARCLNGKICVLQAYDEEAGKFVDVTGDATTSDARKTNRTEMYYDVTAYVTSDHDLYLRNADPKDADGNRYGGITALCNMKLIGAVEITAPAATIARAIKLVSQEEQTPDTENDLAFYKKSLSLKSYVAFDFCVEASVLENYDSWYVQFSRKDAQQGTVTEICEGSSYRDTLYLFEHKIYSVQMADELTATLYAVKDGVTYRGESYTASVADYVMAKFADASEEMKTLYANLLSYGAKAQTYFGYRTDDLADADLGEYSAYVTTTVPTAENVSASTDNGLNGVTLYKNALGLASSVQLQFVMKLSAAYNASDLEARIAWTRNGTEMTETIDGNDFTVGANGKYHVIVFEGLLPIEGHTPVNVTVYDKTTGKAVSETWTYSIASYVAYRRSEAAGDTHLALLNAMLNYYSAAEVCFG